MTASDDLLLRLVRLNWDSGSWTPAHIEPDTDWTTIVQTALNHGVAGLLCSTLVKMPAGEVPQDILDAAGVFLVNADTQGGTLVAQLFDTLDALASGRIPVLPFKGPVLGKLAHASATIRPSQDIDVLVRRQDMDRAVAALRRSGLPP